MQKAEKLIRDYYGLNGSGFEFLPEQSIIFKSGIQVDQYKLIFRNILVEHSAYIVLGKQDNIFSILAESYPIPDTFSVKPVVARETAMILALQYANPQRYSSDFPKGNLVIARNVFGDNQARLAWKFDIVTRSPSGRSLVYVDAKDARIILSDRVDAALPGKQNDKNEEFFPGLVYANESGALVEGLNKIWSADPNPPQKPDTYLGVKWTRQTCNVKHTGVKCPVTVNSGVVKKWFSLVVNGPEDDGYADLGIFHNGGNNYGMLGPSGKGEFLGIGLEAAKSIIRLTELLLTPNTSFMHARIASIQAARALYGADSQAEKTVTDAWYAVNVGAAYKGY
jgi:Zn-dependent metalloprotease